MTNAIKVSKKMENDGVELGLYLSLAEYHFFFSIALSFRSWSISKNAGINDYFGSAYGNIFGCTTA